MLIIIFRMDTQKDVTIDKCGDLAEFTDKKVIVGAKQLRKAIGRGVVFRAYIARNADPALTAPVEDLCRQAGVEYVYVSTMAQLGKMCRIEVGAAMAALVNA